jgi:hypothetical protein
MVIGRWRADVARIQRRSPRLEALPASVKHTESDRRSAGYGEGRLDDDQHVSNATTRTGFRCFDR